MEWVASPLGAHREAVIQLNVEYLTWVYAGVAQTLGVPALVSPRMWIGLFEKKTALAHGCIHSFAIILI